MRLALVAHNVIRGDGQGRINLEIVRHCLNLGHEVTVLADELAPELQAAGVRYIPVRPRWKKPNLLKVIAFAAAADRILRQRRNEIDSIVGNGSVLRERHDVNLCQFVHGAWIASPVHVSKLRRGPYGWYQYHYSARNAAWEKRSYAAAKVVVAPSEKIRQELIHIGVADSHIRVIYNGVDTDEFRPGHEDRAALGLPGGVPLGLFVGDIRTPRKNLDGVLRAVARVPAAHLAVVGAVEHSPFPRLAADLAVTDRVHFLGFRRDVGAIMRAADFFAFPSRYEAGALVLLEAMASGLPVLTARSAGGSELVTSDGGIVLENPDDLDGLVVGMARLVQDGGKRREMGAACRRTAEQHTWGRMAEAYLDLIRECQNETAGLQPPLCHPC
jgi:glycosyltransferase involved in cell wall biosynthesis